MAEIDALKLRMRDSQVYTHVVFHISMEDVTASGLQLLCFSGILLHYLFVYFWEVSDSYDLKLLCLSIKIPC